MMRRCRQIHFAVLGALVASSTVLAQQPGTVVDLTGPNPFSAFVNFAYVFPNQVGYVSGSGTFNTFLRLQDENDPDTAEFGYNVGAPVPNGAKNNMDDVKLGVSLQPNALTRPAPGSAIGTNFYTFALDINEQAATGGILISLDSIKIYGADRALEADNAFPDAANSTDAQKLAYLEDNSTLLWDMDALGETTILLDYSTVSSGSGNADVLFVVSTTNFPAAINGNSDYFIYFYSSMGTNTVIGGREFGAEAGFEEWATVSGLTIEVPPIVPEASTWFAGVSLTALVGGMWYRRRKTA